VSTDSPCSLLAHLIAEDWKRQREEGKLPASPPAEQPQPVKRRNTIRVVSLPASRRRRPR